MHTPSAAQKSGLGSQCSSPLDRLIATPPPRYPPTVRKNTVRNIPDQEVGTFGCIGSSPAGAWQLGPRFCGGSEWGLTEASVEGHRDAGVEQRGRQLVPT